MNWVDFAVIGIILLFALIGMARGFIFSIFGLASFFVSVVVSLKFYPLVAEAMMKSVLYTSIKASILKNLLMQRQTLIPASGGQTGEAAAQTVVDKLSIPGFLKQSVLDRIPDPSKLIDPSRIMDTVSSELARIVISVLSLFLLYALVRVGLIFIRFILEGIARLPLFKQLNRLGGLVLGGVEGILMIYILCTLLVLFNSAPQLKPVFQALDNSLAAQFFYQNNFIVDFMFPKS